MNALARIPRPATMETLPVVPALSHSGHRYSDQRTSWTTRLFGVGGVSLVVLIALLGLVLTWRSYAPAKPSHALSTFQVAPPVAPPEPEQPPEEEKRPEDAPQPVPELQVPIPEVVTPLPATPIAAAAPPAPDPAPPVKEKAALETPPAPTAPQVAANKPTWEGLVLGALNRARRYPAEARHRRQQGIPYIRFVMNRQGNVLSVQLERSSGHPVLDREAISLPKRAQPLPKPPEEVKGDTIELVVPVEFFMRGR